MTGSMVYSKPAALSDALAPTIKAKRTDTSPVSAALRSACWMAASIMPDAGSGMNATGAMKRAPSLNRVASNCPVKPTHPPYWDSPVFIPEQIPMMEYSCTGPSSTVPPWTLPPTTILVVSFFSSDGLPAGSAVFCAAGFVSAGLFCVFSAIIFLR